MVCIQRKENVKMQTDSGDGCNETGIIKRCRNCRLLRNVTQAQDTPMRQALVQTSKLVDLYNQRRKPQATCNLVFVLLTFHQDVIGIFRDHVISYLFNIHEDRMGIEGLHSKNSTCRNIYWRMFRAVWEDEIDTKKRSWNLKDILLIGDKCSAKTTILDGLDPQFRKYNYGLRYAPWRSWVASRKNLKYVERLRTGANAERLKILSATLCNKCNGLLPVITTCAKM